MARHTLTRHQRDAVRETIVWSLASLCSDLDMSLGRNADYDGARRLRREFEDAAAVLDALGWRPDDSRMSFELSLPRKQLRRVARRLKKSVTADLFAHALGFLEGPDENETYERLVVVGRVCVDLLSE